MSYTDKQIVNSYSRLFEGLSTLTKIELIENLSKSLKKEKKRRILYFINHLEHFHLPNRQKK